jgi:hypothetical protein
MMNSPISTIAAIFLTLTSLTSFPFVYDKEQKQQSKQQSARQQVLSSPSPFTSVDAASSMIFVK